MLRIIPNVSAKGAKSYYSTSDYYTEGQELAGVWRGEAAKRLGLTGEVQKTDWDALCDNRNPETGRILTPRQKQNRRIGYDFNFHVPKSVSVLYALTKDDRIMDAFRDSVNETMLDIEAEMKTRVRKSDKNNDRITGNMAWGEFVHFTSRPVDGVPDPHLHAHCFVFNTTWNDQESRWKAGQFGDLKRDAPYFEAVFHSRLARHMSDLGLEVERTKKGWELAGVPKSAIQLFSRRTAEIERLSKERGITDPHEKAELGAKTRDRKQKNLSMEELQALWRSQLAPDDMRAVLGVAGSIGGAALPQERHAACEAIDYAAGHCFERKSVVPERQLLATAMKRSLGQASPEMIEAAFRSGDFVIAEREGRRLATTHAVLAEEQRMIGFAREGRGACARLGDENYRFRRSELNEDQRRAVLHVLTSNDRVILVRGAAGTGKTYSMMETVEAIEAAGKKVFAFAPSADASRGVLRNEAGLADADTVARLLVDEKLLGGIGRGDVIWIDEAGLLGSPAMGQVFDVAKSRGARVVLSGDRRQHGSVERGAALRLLETEAGLVSAEIRAIMRQSGEYKRAVRALSEGRTDDAFRQLDDLGWIREVPDADRYKLIARDYLDAVTHGQTALAVSPTHAEGRRVTNEIRSGLRRLGRLGEDERTFSTLTNSNLTEAQRTDAASYCPGDVLVFHQNAKGFRRGQRVVINDQLDELPLGQAKRFQIFEPGELRLAAGDAIRVTRNGATADGEHRLNNSAIFTVKGFTAAGDIALTNGWVVSKDFSHLTHGYVTTSHASQGKSVDRVFIAQSAESFPASSREQAYVSISRGKRQATIYTDDKTALLEAVRHPDDRLAATELVSQRDIETRGWTLQHTVELEPQVTGSIPHREPEREMVMG